MFFGRNIRAGIWQRKFAFLPVVIGHTSEINPKEISLWLKEYEERIEFVNSGLVIEGMTKVRVSRRPVVSIENLVEYDQEEMMMVM